MDTSEIIKRIKKCMRKEDRKDVEFRVLITLTEVNDIVKYITHDEKLNPGARPHGTKKDEKMAYGQAFVQIIASMILRDIDFKEAIECGIKNWEEADWRKQNCNSRELKGKVAFRGIKEGKAFIVSDENSVRRIEKGLIIIAPTIKPEMIHYLRKASAIITDHGGLTSHPAILARELKVPCIVGTGNASKIISHGSNIKVIARGREKSRPHLNR